MSDREISFDELVRAATGELDADSQRELQQRLDASPTAIAALERVRRVVACLKSHHAVAPSAAAEARAFEIARTRPSTAAAPASSGRPGWLDRITALLARATFDSRLAPSLALRGDEPGYQLTYESELADVDLDVQPESPGRWLLLGHISPREAILIDEIVICPSDGAESYTHVVPGERGVFRVTLASAKYDLVVRSGGRAVLIREITLA